VCPDLLLPSWQCTIIPRGDTASDVRHWITSSPAVRVYIEPNGPAITMSYIGWPGIPGGCGTSLELNTDIRQISVVISDIPALSEVAAVQCVFSRGLNIGLTVLLLYNWHLTNALLATTTCAQCPCNIFLCDSVTLILATIIIIVIIIIIQQRSGRSNPLVYLCTPIGLFATTLHPDGAKFKV